jgi:hypothetical protein
MPAQLEVAGSATGEDGSWRDSLVTQLPDRRGL